MSSSVVTSAQCLSSSVVQGSSLVAICVCTAKEHVSYHLALHYHLILTRGQLAVRSRLRSLSPRLAALSCSVSVVPATATPRPTTSTTPATPSCSFAPTPSSRLCSGPASPTWTSSWLSWSAGSFWTSSPLLNRTVHDPGLYFGAELASLLRLTAFSTGGRARLLFWSSWLLEVFTKVHTNLNGLRYFEAWTRSPVFFGAPPRT